MMGQLICKKCIDAIMLGKVPLFAAPWNIRHNKRINIVHGLTDLEETLVSLRIAFAQIRQLGYKRAQYGLNGTIINVLVDFDRVQHTLPRHIGETQIITVKIKCKLQYKNTYC